MVDPTADDYALALTCGAGFALCQWWVAGRAPVEGWDGLAARLHDLAELLHAEGRARQRTVPEAGTGLCWVEECDGGVCPAAPPPGG